jgi:hypothetical protein
MPTLGMRSWMGLWGLFIIDGYDDTGFSLRVPTVLFIEETN